MMLLFHACCVLRLVLHNALLGVFLMTMQVIVGAEFLAATGAQNLGSCVYTHNVPLHVTELGGCIAANIAK